MNHLDIEVAGRLLKGRMDGHWSHLQTEGRRELLLKYRLVSLLERCPHFRGCYVQASAELGPEDVSLLERYPHFMYRPRWSWDLKLCPY